MLLVCRAGKAPERRRVASRGGRRRSETGVRIADALVGELQDGAVMDEAVGRGHGGHWVLEDLVPLGKHEIGGDDDGLPLVAFGEKVKEDLPLLAGLLGVAELVADD